MKLRRTTRPHTHSPITEGELSAAQHRINAASCHGKDQILNAALKADVPAWQLVLLALLNAILFLREYPIAWRYVLLAPLWKSGKGRSRKAMGDHRPIGLISAVAKLLEQILLARLTPLAVPVLSPDQAGGWLGADAAALYVWELLLLREGGRYPDARN